MSILISSKATMMPRLALGWQMNAISTVVGATEVAACNNALLVAQDVFTSIGISSNIISSQIYGEAEMRTLQNRVASFAIRTFDKQLTGIAKGGDLTKTLWEQRIDPHELRSTYVKQGIVSRDVAARFKSVKGQQFYLSKKTMFDEFYGLAKKGGIFIGASVAIRLLDGTTQIHVPYMYLLNGLLLTLGCVYNARGLLIAKRWWSLFQSSGDTTLNPKRQ